MSWGGGVGSGNLLMASTDAFAAGSASVQAISARSVSFTSGFIVQTATNVGGSAAAITGLPQFYLQINYNGTDYLLPIYRKT